MGPGLSSLPATVHTVSGFISEDKVSTSSGTNSSTKFLHSSAISLIGMSAQEPSNTSRSSPYNKHEKNRETLFVFLLISAELLPIWRIFFFKSIFSKYLRFVRDELITCFLDHFLADFTDIIIILGVRIGTPNTINAMASGLTFWGLPEAAAPVTWPPSAFFTP